MLQKAASRSADASRLFFLSCGQEVRGMFVVMDQKRQDVAAGQAEVDRATKQFRSAAAADRPLVRHHHHTTRL